MINVEIYMSRSIIGLQRGLLAYRPSWIASLLDLPNNVYISLVLHRDPIPIARKCRLPQKHSGIANQRAFTYHC